MVSVHGADQHHEVVDVTTSRHPRVLMVVANPTTSTTTGWPVGFWAAELTHPYYEFNRRSLSGHRRQSRRRQGRDRRALRPPRRVEVVGRRPDLDGLLSTPELAALLEDTPRIADLDLDDVRRAS